MVVQVTAANISSTQPYYETRAVIRYRGTSEQNWPEPPHQALANFQLDDATVRLFTRRYGPLYTMPSNLEAIDGKRNPDDPIHVAVKKMMEFVPDLERVQGMQILLRRACVL